MLHILALSSQIEVGNKLEQLCGELLKEQYHIERFSSGQDAAGYFRGHDPDLVFIDAVLPDMNGIKLAMELRMREHMGRFVLILERGEVRAKDIVEASAAGITDCVFYPFSNEEVSYILLGTECREHFQIDMEFQLAKSIRSLRNSFMDQFLESDSVSASSIETLNAKYHMNLSSGTFQVAIISFPGLTDEREPGKYQMMLDSIVEDTRHILDPVCFEMVPFIRLPNTIVLVANYATSKNVKQQLGQLPQVILDNIATYCGFELPFVIGVGSPEYDSIYLKRAFRTAQYAQRCQLLFGRNRMFVYDDYAFDRIEMEREDCKQALAELAGYTEMLDAKGASYAVSKVMAVLTSNADPECISELCEKISLTVVTSLNKISSRQEPVSKLSDISRYLDMESSLSGLKVAVSGWVQALIVTYLKAEDQVMLRPIREAKQYIDQNYSRHLTLQSVAEKIDLSATYFCTLFKQEVGVPFSVYLTGLRVEQAKCLLRETDLDMMSISERVGYRDSRYFSRVFFKEAGVPPTAYRDLNKSKRTS